MCRMLGYIRNITDLEKGHKCHLEGGTGKLMHAVQYIGKLISIRASI